MKTTNKLDLPQPIVDAVKNDDYDKGDAHISITGLIAPARIRVLEKLYKDKLVEDVGDRIWVLLGQVMHGILERSKTKHGIHEKRWTMLVDGVRISGQLDAYYQNGLIQDYKLVSLYSVKDGVKPEYEEQLNCYAALLRYNDLPVTKLELVCILRDWSKGKARQDETIPQQQVIKLEVPMWSQDKAMEFIQDRVKAHKQASKVLPDCTPEERWAVPDKWAVMPKKNAARSLRNYESKEAAEEHSSQVKGSFVEIRKGANNRCDAYCRVAEWCTQYKRLQEEK